MHLRRPGLHIVLVNHLQKNKERSQKFEETGYSKYIYQNKLGKACFQRDMAYGDFNILTRITVSHKILPDKAFDIAKNPKYDRNQRGLAAMAYKFFDKKTFATIENKFAGSGIKMRICQTSN